MDDVGLAAAPRARRTAGIDPVIAELVRLGTELRRLRDANATEPSAAAVRGTIDGAIDGALGAVLDTIRRLGQGADDASDAT